MLLMMPLQKVVRGTVGRPALGNCCWNAGLSAGCYEIHHNLFCLYVKGCRTCTTTSTIPPPFCIIVLNKTHHSHVVCISDDMMGGVGGSAVMGKQDEQQGAQPCSIPYSPWWSCNWIRKLWTQLQIPVSISSNSASPPFAVRVAVEL